MESNETGAPSNGRHNVLRPPAPLPHERAHNNSARELKGTTGPVVFHARQLWKALVSFWAFELFLHILVVYITFVALPNAVPKVPCKLPVIHGYFLRCTHNELGYPRKHVAAPNFFALAQLHSQLEEVMEDSASSSKVAVDIKDSEMALRDLSTLIRYSSLAGGDDLARDLKIFASEAKATSGSLQEFGNLVWGAVDRIVSENEHILITLQARNSFEISRGVSTSIINSLAPVEQEPTVISPRESSEDLWPRSITLLDRYIRKLTHESKISIGLLQNLESRLTSVRAMAVAAEAKLLAEKRAFKWPWSKDKKIPQFYSTGLECLQKIQYERERALYHITGVLHRLERIAVGLDRLRKGAATPIIVGDTPDIRTEPPLTYLQSVTEQLIYGKTRMRETEDEYRRVKFTSSPPQPNYVEY